MLLSRPYPLFDVDDVEAFCGRIVRFSGLDLTYHEREEIHVYLIEEAWILSTRYRPGGVKFSTWAGRILRLRTVDWVRGHRGRTKWQFADSTYERPRTKLISLDGLDPDHDPLGPSVGHGSLDDDAHRVSDQLRALDKRGRRPARRGDWLGA